MLCVAVSSLPWYPVFEHPGSLAKISFCLEVKDDLKEGRGKKKEKVQFVKVTP